jgi:hypothetical protein
LGAALPINTWGLDNLLGGQHWMQQGGFASYKDPPRVIKNKKDTKRKILIGEKVQMQMKAKQAKQDKMTSVVVKRCDQCKSMGKKQQLPQVVF